MKLRIAKKILMGTSCSVNCHSWHQVMLADKVCRHAILRGSRLINFSHYRFALNMDDENTRAFLLFQGDAYD
jgi:hypothetical protein